MDGSDAMLTHQEQARAQGAGDLVPPKRAARRRIQTSAAAAEGDDILTLIIIDGKQEPVVMSRAVAASLASVLVRALA